MARERLTLPCTVSSDKLRVSNVGTSAVVKVIGITGTVKGSAYLSKDSARELAMWLFAYIHTGES